MVPRPRAAEGIRGNEGGGWRLIPRPRAAEGIRGNEGGREDARSSFREGIGQGDCGLVQLEQARFV